MGLMAVTHNIMILRAIKLFYRASPTPFSLIINGACRPAALRCEDSFS